jgi:beta-propeller repeat-containing protein
MKHTRGLGMLGILAFASIGILIFNPVRGRVEQIATKRTVNGERPTSRPVVASYGKLPLSFERNEGQADGKIRFLSHGPNYSLFLTGTEVILTGHELPPAPNSDSMPGDRRADRSAAHVQPAKEKPFRMTVVGADPDAKVSGLEELPGKANYFIGNDPKKWRRNVPTYAKVKYEAVYPGVDLIYYGSERQLEYDFVVAPSADPKVITLALAAEEKGDAAPQLDAKGDLVLGTGRDEIRFKKPLIYQLGQDAKKQVVDGRFVLKGGRQVGFELGAYDASKPLVIDPILAYSTYFGGSESDTPRSIAVDSDGNAYMAGDTRSSTDFPTNKDVSPHDDRGLEAFVAKISADGSTRIFSTYLGGDDVDSAGGIAVDPDGNVYVTGETRSENFPTLHAFREDPREGPDNTMQLFIAKIAADGDSLLYSSYYGGTNDGGSTSDGIAVDELGNAYITGHAYSRGFPTTPGVLQPEPDGWPSAFLAKIDTTKDGSDSLVYSTYLGGTEETSHTAFGESIAIDSEGCAYVAGHANSTTFPLVNPIVGTQPGFHVFVSKFNPDASALIYSTFLASGSAGVGGIAVDDLGNAYVATSSTPFGYPFAYTTLGPGGYFDLLVTKINAAGDAFEFSTFIGGSGLDLASGIALDASDHVYLTGNTTSLDFPLLNAVQDHYGGDSGVLQPLGDAFALKLKADGSALLYSTYLGGSGDERGVGIGVDAGSNAYIAGLASDTFPVTEGAYQTFNRGKSEAFLAKLSLRPDFTLGPISPINIEVGGTGSTQVTIHSIDEFAELVKFGPYGVPAGLSPSMSPDSVTPEPNASASSRLSVSAGASLTAGSYSFTVRADAGGPLFHDGEAVVNVKATSGGITNVIGTLQALGCVDNSGIGNALTTKLASAQALIDAGKIQAAINTLTALLNQLQAQAGKHILTSCTADGVTFNPVQVLIDDVKALLASLGVNLKANPIMGNVLNSSKLGIGGITVNILSSTKAVVATAPTDVTGFYYVPTTTNLIPGANYTVRVVVPKGYRNSTPTYQTFTWRATALSLGNFLVN